MGSPRHLEADGSSSKERFVYLRSEHEHVRHIIDPAKCSGKVKSIGVSNFSEVKLEEILPTAEIIPAVNQVNIFILQFITFLTQNARGYSVGTSCV